MGRLDMKELNLYRLWELCNTLSKRQSELWEEDKYIYLLGLSSDYMEMNFHNFLEYYSFKFEDNNIVVFNDDGIPYEDYTNRDFSYVPLPVLGFGEEELENYIDQSVKMQLEEQRLAKIAEKEGIKKKIELLQKQLER